MIRFIKNQTNPLKSASVQTMSKRSGDDVSYRAGIDLEANGSKLSLHSHLRSLVLWTVFFAMASGPFSTGKAEVLLNDGSERIGEIAADLGALGTETSNAKMACWQNGKEVFNAAEFNTVSLGGLTGESAITLTNNTDGTQALAISLNDGLCFVTIEPEELP